jgi:hypothetical protein
MFCFLHMWEETASRRIGISRIRGRTDLPASRHSARSVDYGADTSTKGLRHLRVEAQGSLGGAPVTKLCQHTGIGSAVARIVLFGEGERKTATGARSSERNGAVTVVGANAAKAWCEHAGCVIATVAVTSDDGGLVASAGIGVRT